MNILTATTDAEIIAAFSALHALRPHLVESEFVARVRHQQVQGYQLIYIRDADGVSAAAGFRILEFLAWGKVLYIDDLITLPGKRKSGCGGQLMDWLIARAREQRCDQLHLDSGFQRYDAHRLYLNKGLRLDCHHFAMNFTPHP